MIVPHNTNLSRRFEIGFGTIAFCLLLVVAVVVAGAYIASGAFGATAIIDERDGAEQQTSLRMATLLSELDALLSVASEFEPALTGAVRSLAGEHQEEPETDSSPSFNWIRAASVGAPKQVEDVHHLAETLEAALKPIEDMKAAVLAQRVLLREIPNGWPVAGGRGRVTFEFGPNRHPITDQWYLHKGIDIAGPPGTPIVASADGIVTEAGVDVSYGRYVWVQHKYGFRTLYPHLRRTDVSEGQTVLQGDQLGTMGSSGIATGVHLHFELWLGGDVLDPAAFLQISNTFNRWARDSVRW